MAVIDNQFEKYSLVVSDSLGFHTWDSFASQDDLTIAIKGFLTDSRYELIDACLSPTDARNLCLERNLYFPIFDR